MQQHWESNNTPTSQQQIISVLWMDGNKNKYAIFMEEVLKYNKITVY